jgi:hypothetical protein
MGNHMKRTLYTTAAFCCLFSLTVQASQKDKEDGWGRRAWGAVGAFCVAKTIAHAAGQGVIWTASSAAGPFAPVAGVALNAVLLPSIDSMSNKAGFAAAAADLANRPSEKKQ